MDKQPWGVLHSICSLSEAEWGVARDGWEAENLARLHMAGMSASVFSGLCPTSWAEDDTLDNH